VEIKPLKLNQGIVSRIGLPKNSWGATRDGITDPRVKTVVENYVNKIDSLFSDVNLIIIGPSHCGKTSILSIIGKACRVKRKHVFYINSLEYKKALFKKDSEYEERASSVDLLLFDDFGSEIREDWYIEKIYLLLKSRFDNNKPTHFTSNMSVEMLKKNFLSHIGFCGLIDKMIPIIVPENKNLVNKNRKLMKELVK